MANTVVDRYQSRPFLRLLDSYILDAIGQLGDEPRKGLETMQPRFAKIFGIDQPWQEIVRAQMELPDSLPEQIRMIWAGYLLHAQQQGQPVSPNEFVEQFVNENFGFIFDH